MSCSFPHPPHAPGPPALPCLAMCFCPHCAQRLWVLASDAPSLELPTEGLLFRGLRVRLALASGVAPGDPALNASSRRTVYNGVCVCARTRACVRVTGEGGGSGGRDRDDSPSCCNRVRAHVCVFGRGIGEGASWRTTTAKCAWRPPHPSPPVVPASHASRTHGPLGATASRRRGHGCREARVLRGARWHGAAVRLGL